jgi:hypothetical protein
MNNQAPVGNESRRLTHFQAQTEDLPPPQIIGDKVRRN